MINKNKIKELMKKADNILDDESPELEAIWEEIVDLLSDNLEETKAYLSELDSDDLWMIAGYFEDLSSNFQDKSFIDFLNELKTKHPDLDLEEDIRWADKAIT